MTPDSTNTSPDAKGSGLSRRAIVGTAAWAAPAIVLTAASPAAAASNPTPSTNPTVAFTTSPPSPVAPGGTFPDFVVKATTDGVNPAPAGDIITIVLLGGATFADGSTFKDFPATGTLNSLTVSGVKAGSIAAGDQGNIAAVYKTAQAMQTLTIAAAALPSGNLYAWGYNAEGQVGDGQSGNRTLPARWLGGGQKYTGVFGAWSSFAAITTIGTIYATGNNASGPFGNGLQSGNSKSGPVGPALNATKSGPFMNAAKFVQMHGSHDQTIWLWGTDGKLYAFGENSGGKFSFKDGSTAGSADNSYGYPQVTPVGTEILWVNAGKKIVSVSDSGWYRAVYLLSDGTVWNAGSNRYYAMGNNGAQDAQYLAAQTVKSDLKPLTGIVAAVTTEDAAMYLDGAGKLWGAGTNTWGQLPGIPTSPAKTAMPLTQPGGKLVSKIWADGCDQDSFFAQTTDGALYITGNNTGGVGSTGSTSASKNVWTRVNLPAGKTLAKLAPGGEGALYMMTDGTVYFAGKNDTGGAGNGTSGGYITTMVKVSLPGPAIDVAATWYDSYAAVVAS